MAPALAARRDTSAHTQTHAGHPAAWRRRREARTIRKRRSHARTCLSSSLPAGAPALPRGVRARARPRVRYVCIRADAPRRTQPPSPLLLLALPARAPAAGCMRGVARLLSSATHLRRRGRSCCRRASSYPPEHPRYLKIRRARCSDQSLRAFAQGYTYQCRIYRDDYGTDTNLIPYPHPGAFHGGTRSVGVPPSPSDARMRLRDAARDTPRPRRGGGACGQWPPRSCAAVARLTPPFRRTQYKGAARTLRGRALACVRCPVRSGAPRRPTNAVSSRRNLRDPSPSMGAAVSTDAQSGDEFFPIRDKYKSVRQVSDAIRQAGVESCNLIIAVDFTKSNEWAGQRSFHNLSLHDVSAEVPNPYEQAIGIVGKTLRSMDEDGLIPCFGFGDASTHDRHVFSFNPDHAPCQSLEHALARYREIAPFVKLAGPTSFAPAVEMAASLVQRSGNNFHILLLIADGQVTRSADTDDGRLSAQEQVGPRMGARGAASACAR
eukprot:scaffold685_cov324-Prasinococcus_capsulatus_cf.AAC.2